MDSATQQVEQQHTQPSEDDIYHPPRPSAKSRFYTVTVGKKTGVYQGGDDWHSQVDGISGNAVRSFDSLKAAQQAYEDAIDVGGLVFQVEQTGERRVLTEEDVQSIPGMQAPDPLLSAQKWYSVYVGTQPGLYPGSQNVSPLISNVKGGRSARWQSYEQAYDSFMMDLQGGRIVQDTTVIIRTPIVEE